MSAIPLPATSRLGRATRSVRVLARACHPEPTVAVTGISLAYALAGGAGRRAPVIGAAVLAQQLSIGWSNDALDAARDRADARTDKPLVDEELSPRAVLTAATVALAASVPLSLAAGGTGVGTQNLVCAAAGWAYNVGLKATPVSPVPYAVGFGGLAAFFGGATHPDRRPAAPVVAAGVLLGTAAHFANVLPDIDDDLAHGIAGLPQRLGAARSRRACAVLLGTAGGVLGWTAGRSRAGRILLAGALAVPAVGGVAAAGTGAHGSRASFRLVLVVAAADIGLLLTRARR